VCEVTVTFLVTAGTPRAFHALTHTGTLITRRLVAVTVVGTFHPPVAPAALTPACLLVTVGAVRPPRAQAWLGAGRRPPAFLTGAVSVDGVAVAMSGALTGVLAERTPAVGVAGALTSDRMTTAIWVARTHLTTVRSPEFCGTSWWQI